ncbi:MAG TPA: beta-ketoacyl-ACP synthase III [Nitrospiria bacterium]|nr:beta-ketoacyl-ACP synthase III [Nitrospiria bacterium]
MIRSRVTGTGAYLPDRRLTNQELERMVETSDRWIVERTGIRERRIAAPEEATSDLAAAAGRQALTASGVAASSVELIIVATATPDMLFPSTACLVQERLGAKQAFAFDLSAACTGFLYALAVADQYIRTGTYRTVLVIGAEVLSRMIDWTDRTTCILFGDGAGAVVVQADRGARGVLSTHLHSDGSLWDLIHIPGGGSRRPPSAETLADRMNFVKMKGSETFRVAVRALEEVAREALAANQLSPEQVSWIIPHQANLRILQAVAERLKVPADKVVINVDRYGNTSAASIPIALDEVVRAGRVRSDDLLLLEAFGAGLTWGAAVVRW